MPAARVTSSSRRTSSEPNTLPPGEFTRSTSAFTSLFSRAFLIRLAVERPPMVPAGDWPSTISPSATTTPIASPVRRGLTRPRYSSNDTCRKLPSLSSLAPRSIISARSSSRVFRPSTNLAASASLASSPPTAASRAGASSITLAMVPAGSFLSFSTAEVYVAHRSPLSALSAASAAGEGSLLMKGSTALLYVPTRATCTETPSLSSASL